MPESGCTHPPNFLEQVCRWVWGKRGHLYLRRGPSDPPRPEAAHLRDGAGGRVPEAGGGGRRARGKASLAAGRDSAGVAWAVWFPLSNRKERKGKRSR